MIEFIDDYKIGVRAIDNQHQEFINLYNKLERMMESKTTLYLSSFISELFDAIYAQFRNEETIMEILHYTLLKDHKLEHKMFMATLDGLTIRMQENDAELSELLELLKYWIDSHIKISDRDFGDFYRIVNNAR